MSAFPGNICVLLSYALDIEAVEEYKIRSPHKALPLHFGCTDIQSR
jgi:hypothetical protein